METIKERRRVVQQYYHHHLRPLEEQGLLRLPVVPQECESHARAFYLLLQSETQRDALMTYPPAARRFGRVSLRAAPCLAHGSAPWATDPTIFPLPKA